MKRGVYLVGGAVRDEIMGVPCKDRDYVVVGSSHQEMIDKGFTQVGSSFPVYLHPTTKEEYALARRERSTGDGYHDFEVEFGPGVTIEEDLGRRDLTINAIAKNMNTGEYIDPYNGIWDIKAKVLKGTSEVSFREDPLRTYRLARLWARYGGEFKIDHKTVTQLWTMGDLLKSLPVERKVAEINKCFSDLSRKNTPSLMFKLLVTLGEFPELDQLKDIPQPVEHHPEGDAYVHTMMCLDYAAGIRANPRTKWAVLCHDLGKVCYRKHGDLHGHEEYGVPIVESLCGRLRVPNEWRDLAVVVCRNHTRLHKISEMSARKVYDLLQQTRGEKDYDFASDFCEACLCDARGRGREKEIAPYPQRVEFWEAILSLNNNRDIISEKASRIADNLKGRPDLIRAEVRAMKIGHIRRALKEYRLGKKCS